MLNVSGYQIHQQIYAGTRTLVFSATRDSNGEPVIIKLLKSKYPSLNELVQFRNQYTIAKSLNCDGIIKTYSLENYENSYALVMEDFGGISLKDYTGNKPLDISEFFAIAFQIVDALAELYKNGLIHKDIKPANILINPNTKEIKIIDFSIASSLPKETQALKSANVLEGTLAYISPEQTGRMNRVVDWRSDFYSLGITFFELLTGELPFLSNDPMELVYNHLAKTLPYIQNINPEVPAILAEIIVKLTAKNAEERYQSASGLKFDLETIWNHFQETGQFPELHSGFQLASRDIPSRFSISEKLYGREAEVNTLLSAFSRISSSEDSHNQSVEMILVAGFSGIGKTAVVHEVHKPIVRQRGYFIKGKYDQFQRNIPLDAFIQAFRSLMEQILSESAAQLQEWKHKILEALGEQAQIIIDVIPELEKIIGTQPPVVELTGSSATNRFNLLFQKIIQVFSSQEHPLVIFIDDLQWADSASLKLMEIMMCESEIHNLLLIGAYRDNEVSPAHPLTLTLNEIAKKQISIQTITLNPLSKNDLSHLVADTLKCSIEIVVPLTELIYQKTKGNPFFSNQLLQYLYEEDILQFDVENYYWQCNISQLKQLILADDVVDFMANRLQTLPLNTQNILRLAACIGNKFDLKTLSIVNNKSLEDTASDLWAALREGLIIPTNEIYKLYQETNLTTFNPELDELTQLSPNYKFLHDRVQQAAYSLIPEAQKKTTHLRIGKLLLENIPESERYERVFDIVNHLNYSKELIQEENEINQLAQLNLTAGRKAKVATAYTTAVNYFDVALSKLNQDCWETEYKFTLQLYEEACDAAYLSGNFKQMDGFAETVIQKSENILEQIRVYEIKIQAYMVQNRLKEALDISLYVLKELDIHFPESPTQSDIEQAFQTTASKWSDREIADLINLPTMTDAKPLAAMKILLSVFPVVYVGFPVFVPLTALKMVDISIDYGNTDISAYGYCSYGLLLCSVINDIEHGYDFGKLSLKILENSNNRLLEIKVRFLYNIFIYYWKESGEKTLKLLQNIYLLALENGDFEYVAYCLYNYSIHAFLTGKELTDLVTEMAVYVDKLELYQQATILSATQIFQQTVLNLTSQTENPHQLIGEAYDESVMLPIHHETNYITAIAIVYFNKLLLNYLFGNYSEAFTFSIEAEKYLSSLTGHFIVPTYQYYDSLTRLEVSTKSRGIEQKQLIEKVKSNQQKMLHWAKHAPMNFLHKYYLVEAELHRVTGDKLAAIDYYDRAIALAKENGYLQEEALSNELAAKFYFSWGKQTIGQAYLTNAYYCYVKWGAVAKVHNLEENYPNLNTSFQAKEEIHFSSTETVVFPQSTEKVITAKSSTTVVESLDFISFIKASQVISSEIKLDTLLIKLTQVLIENAGASKAVIIMPKSNKWVIEAIALSTNSAVDVLKSIPIEESQDIPKNLVNYISRTQEKLIVNNTPNELQNKNSTISKIFDRYLIEKTPQSLLCTPILHQGEVIAILYLENNLMTGSFSDERMQVIKLLTSQAAISLENARLYQQSQDYARKAEENAKQLEQSLEELKQAQIQLVQSEKMSTLGNLVSGIGHEINNPIGFLAGNLQPAQDYAQDLLKLINIYQNNYPEPGIEIVKNLKKIDFEYIQEDFPKVLKSMQQAIDRIYDISISLRTFSRADTQKKIPFNIHEGLNSTLVILNHRLKARKDRPAIKVIKEYDDFPAIKCFPGQLNQVFMNLLANAIDALEESNTGRSYTEIEANPNCITITTQMNEVQETVNILIKDNGPGMPEEVKEKIFEHLFTTKPVGKGTGLGLAITHQIIVDKHGGKIDVVSSPKEGACFVISIPID